METDVIRRNYSTVILSFLRERTSRLGDHYTAEEICDKLNEKYGVKPDRKTVLNAIRDLRSLGFDIVSDRGKNAGFYLDERELTLSDLSLISDSVEAMKVPVEMKTTLYEKLEKITGIKTKEFDPAFYDDENFYADEETEIYKERLKTALQAIRENRQLVIHTLCSLPVYFIKEPSNEVLDHFRSCDLNFLNWINPVKVFHNKENRLFLFFYVTVGNETCFGAFDIVTPLSMILSEETFIPVSGLMSAMSDIDINNFESAAKHRKGLEKLSAGFCLVNGPLGWFYEDWLQRLCISVEERKAAGSGSVRVIRYYRKDLNGLLNYFIQNADSVKLLRNDLDNENVLYDALHDLYLNLERTYKAEENSKC